MSLSIWPSATQTSLHVSDRNTHTHTHIYRRTHACTHSHSHKHMRMRHISPQLLCWIHPNMVGDISMATAGRRGADLCWMIYAGWSPERVCFLTFDSNYSLSIHSTVWICASCENTKDPEVVAWLLRRCNYTAWAARLQTYIHAVLLYRYSYQHFLTNDLAVF